MFVAKNVNGPDQYLVMGNGKVPLVDPNDSGNLLAILGQPPGGYVLLHPDTLNAIPTIPGAV